MNKNINLPNVLSFSRIIAAPFFVNAVLKDNKLLALLIFVYIICSDFLDGYIARKGNIITRFGKILDPVSAAIFIYAGLFALTVIEYLSPMMFVLLLFVGALRFIGLYLIYKSSGQIRSTIYSKSGDAMIEGIFLWFLLAFPFTQEYVSFVIIINLLIGIKRNLDGIRIIVEVPKK